MATVTAPPQPTTEPGQVVLHSVPWDLYCQLRDEAANSAVRMTYLDGALTLMSPELEHDGHGQLLGYLVRGVVGVMGLELRSAGSTTLRLRTEVGQGAGKEPDLAFFIGADELRMRGRWQLDLSVDPPPSLAIEVDHTHGSTTSLPVYARLGIPEVWRFRVRDRSLWMGRLVGADYQEVSRSVVLPRLTPALIVAALDRFEVGDLGEMAWSDWITRWAAALPES